MFRSKTSMQQFKQLRFNAHPSVCKLMFHYMTANITLHHHLLNLKNVCNHHSCHHIILLFTLLFFMTHHCPYHLLCVSNPHNPNFKHLKPNLNHLNHYCSRIVPTTPYLFLIWFLKNDQLDEDEIKLLTVVEIIDAQGYY